MKCPYNVVFGQWEEPGSRLGVCGGGVELADRYCAITVKLQGLAVWNSLSKRWKQHAEFVMS